MSPISNSLGRLKNASFDELRVRSSQKFAAFAERHGWSSLAKLPSDQHVLASLISKRFSSADELLEHFRLRLEPLFFQSFSDQELTVSEFRKQWPEAVSQIVERADAVIDGRFQLLGHKDLSFGSPIDWHFEPLFGKRIPLVHWSKVDYLDAEHAGDKKVVWELNRHQYFSTLGQAYWLTGDERYAETFVNHLESWMDQNPPKVGINWASSLEIAFRSISWLWGFYFFRDSAALNPQVFMRALKFLYLNARHLETYLSTYFSPNTHLTGEALGLFYLGLLLPEFRDSSRWRELGTRILLDQMPLHVRPDGVYFEQSSYYHRYTTDFYIHFLILSRANGLHLSDDVQSRLKKLLDHLMYITKPDGTTPLFGDDDGGKLMALDHRPANDLRAALSTGAALFERSDYAFVAGEPFEETLWLLGPVALARLDGIRPTEPAELSIGFPHGGYFVMRDDWSSKGNYLLFDAGPLGSANCGHAHADALSFELAANGRSILVDPGTFTYTGSKELRDWFRSSRAHNTLTLADRSSSIPSGPFSWMTKAEAETSEFITARYFDYVAGSHNGYVPQLDHERSILFLKHNYWIVRDHLKPSDESQVNLWFHFDAASRPLIEASGGEAFVADSSEAGLDVVSFAPGGRWHREDGRVSNCYSQQQLARVYAFEVNVSGSDNIFTFLLPSSVDSRWRVTEIEAVGGQAFEVTNEKWVDIVMIRSSERVETARLQSDFEWSWVRFLRHDLSVPVQLVLLGGNTLALEGRELITTDQGVTHVSANRRGNEFRIEPTGRALSLRQS